MKDIKMKIKENKLLLLKDVNRVEVINESGRAYVNLKCSNVNLSLQDDKRTLKIFTNPVNKASEIYNNIKESEETTDKPRPEVTPTIPPPKTKIKSEKFTLEEYRDRDFPLVDCLIAQSTMVGEMVNALGTIYLNFKDSDDVRGSSMIKMIEGLAEKNSNLMYILLLYDYEPRKRNKK